MKTLALEFSSEQRSAAVAVEREIRGVATSALGAGSACQAFELVEAALGQAGLKREGIECLAVGLGPGSYTGIRVAIALAQGWQLACQVKVLGVSSVEAIAAQAWEEGCRGALHVAIDAQRNEAYVATYEVQDTGWQEVSPLKLVATGEVVALAARGELVAGPQVRGWQIAGRTLYPNARQLALLAAGRSSFVAGEELTPIYLRATTFVKAPPPRSI
jgi:tRNA threonylcarbamoyl adenosine modification protein YeaZ